MAIKTRTRYVIMSSDYSQQEPKVLAQLTGDNNMLDAYRQGKDLYSQIAAIAFHSTYEKCLEHFPKGTPIKQNKETGYWEFGTKEDHDKDADGVTDTYHDGKERRSQAKKILLGRHYAHSV